MITALAIAKKAAYSLGVALPSTAVAIVIPVDGPFLWGGVGGLVITLVEVKQKEITGWREIASSGLLTVAIGALTALAMNGSGVPFIGHYLSEGRVLPDRAQQFIMGAVASTFIKVAIDLITLVGRKKA